MVVESLRQTGFKQEAVELTPEALVAAQYGTVWEGAEITEDGEFNERRPDRATNAPLQGVAGAFIGKFSGKFEPRPSGTDATPPDWYALCAAAGGVVTTDNVAFGAELAASGLIGKSVTIKTRDGAWENVLAGARFSKLRFFAEKGGVWSCESEATGRFSRSAQTSFVSGANPSSGLGQPFLGMACAIGAFSGSVASVEISIENTVAPAKDGTHASGYGNNVITEQKLMFRAKAIIDSTDWRDKFRNDSSSDLLAISVAMATGAAGNVLTWTGSICLTVEPKTEYIDGIGYVDLEGEFISSTGSAALTLTQS